MEAGVPHRAPEFPISKSCWSRGGRCWPSSISCPKKTESPTELRSRSRLVMCLTAVDQSAPEALEESRRVEELARRLGDHEVLLRNYMILIPWWQASAEYRTINAILAEARKEAVELNDVLVAPADHDIRGDDAHLAGKDPRGSRADAHLLRRQRSAAGRRACRTYLRCAR